MWKQGGDGLSYHGMEPLHELNELVKHCDKRPVWGAFPQDANGPLADRAAVWLEKYSELIDVPAFRHGMQKLREFLLLHRAATSGSVPVQKAVFYIVIDTSVFFHREEILDHLSVGCILAVPKAVLDELRNRARSRNAQGRKSRRILERIHDFPRDRICYISFDTTEYRQKLAVFPVQSLNDRCDHRILAAAKRLTEEGKPTRLLSDDIEMRKKAVEIGVVAVSLREFFADW